MTILLLPRISKWIAGQARRFFGIDQNPAWTGRSALVGLGLSGVSLVAIGAWLLTAQPHIGLGQWLSGGLFGFGIFNILAVISRRLALPVINQLSFVGNLAAVVAFYLFFSRFVVVSYTTDTIVGTYMGVLKALQFQSPYSFTIKPLMDQFGLTPSFYTPSVNGSIDFHLAYPSLSFLSVLPFYVLGLRDVRDTIFMFHLLSIIAIFGLAPARLKSVSLAPFAWFPYVIAAGWTDSVWAFFLVLTAFLWYRHRKVSFVTFGLAVAAKQLAIIVAPFLLIRLLRETPQSKIRNTGTAAILILSGLLIPNLPFIITTPSAWWNDIVAPYLPNASPQVPGGIGLSNILLDVGIAIPSSFFLVLVLGASTVLLYAYARHFTRLNSLTFAFPILLFFFYSRSFPDYMAYWLFPLVLDLCRLGRPSLKLALAARIRSIDWHLPTGTFLRVFPRRRALAVLIVIVLTVAFVATSEAYVSQASSSNAEIQINNVMDPDSIGAATMINITLKNTLQTPVSPTFFVKWYPLPYLWTSNSTALLNSGSRGSYIISAADGVAPIPRGSAFHVIVYDKLTSQLLGESPSAKANVAAPALSNPGLKWWTLDESLGRKVPLGWKLSLFNSHTTTSGITPLSTNGTSGVQMILNYAYTERGIDGLALSQQISPVATSVSVHFNQSFSTNPATKLIFAASVTDGTHTIFFIFSNQVTQQIIMTYSTNITVIIPTQKSEWNAIILSPQSIWNARGWAIPPQATLTLFLESELPGVYYVSITSVSPV